MSDRFAAQKLAYANLIVRAGVNLEPGQAVVIRAELGHREFVRILAQTAYDAGAKHVEVGWVDPVLNKIRFQQVDRRYLGYVPEFETTRYTQFLADNWARISLTGEEYPGVYDDVDPALQREYRASYHQQLGFYFDGTMNNEIPWCVAGVPVAPWAQKVFPDLPADAALERLWELVLRVCRADQPDPIEAWRRHDANLKRVVDFMDRRQVRAIRYLDEKPGPDGQPSTDLTVGLTDRPAWSAGSSNTVKGVSFFANIPTEEIFSTPHRERVDGWVRTSKPGFPFERELLDAYFRFENGEVVAWDAAKGKDVLDQLFEIAGARRLGELSLVDVRSPINQSGVLFCDTLFDENAVCHIAFGQAYPEGVQDGNKLSREELDALGVNASDAHEDLMIGTETMKVIGACADGSEVLIMENGRFTPEVLA